MLKKKKKKGVPNFTSVDWERWLATDDQIVGTYLRETKLTLQLSAKYRFILSSSHKIRETFFV